MDNFQRKGSISNAHVGRDFEERARAILAAHGILVETNHRVPCGLGKRKKMHNFDFGSYDPPIIVECKSQTWTSGDKVPVAKIHNWAVTMYYFHMAPTRYQKIFFAEESLRRSSGESLLAYFRRTHGHMIPPGVKFWELPRLSDKVSIFSSQDSS